MADLTAMPVKRPPPSFEPSDEPPCDRYVLCDRVPCGDDDECYVAMLPGMAGYRVYLFLRRFPAKRLDEPTFERFKRIARVNGSGIEQFFELSRATDHPFVASELVEGIGLGQLDARLAADGQRLPWEVALALLFDATDRIRQLRAADALHGGITPARLRLAATGKLVLCHGVPATDASWMQALYAVVRPILRLAATEPERKLLDGVLDDADSTDGLVVASDALVVRHPELDLVLPALFQALVNDEAPARERVRAMLAERLDPAAVRQLWAIVRDAVGDDPH